MEFVHLAQYLMRPGTRGSSGIDTRCLSRARLNASTEQPDRLRICDGRQLNNLGPLTPMVPNLIVWIRQDAD